MRALATSYRTHVAPVAIAFNSIAISLALAAATRPASAAPAPSVQSRATQVQHVLESLGWRELVQAKAMDDGSIYLVQANADLIAKGWSPGYAASTTIYYRVYPTEQQAMKGLQEPDFGLEPNDLEFLDYEETLDLAAGRELILRSDGPEGDPGQSGLPDGRIYSSEGGVGFFCRTNVTFGVDGFCISMLPNQADKAELYERLKELVLAMSRQIDAALEKSEHPQ